MDRRQTGQAVTGALLVAVGIIFLGDRLGWGPAWNMGQMWPVLTIVAGLAQLVSAEHGRWQRGLFFVCFGLIFLLDRLHVLALRDSWPLFIVSAGVAVLLGHGNCDKRKSVARHGE